MKLYDVITVNRADGKVYSVPCKDLSREKADGWRESLEKRSSGHLRVVVVKAGEYAAGDVWRETVDEEE